MMKLCGYHWNRPAWLLAGLLLLMVSCGGNGEPTEPASATPAAEGPSAAESATAAPDSAVSGDLRQQQQDILKAYIDGLEEAEDAADVARAIRDYTRRLKELAPRLKTRASGGGSETGRLPANFDVLTERLLNASIKTERFADDPDVRAAQAELRRVQKELE
jgi:hypothetical protein